MKDVDNGSSGKASQLVKMLKAWKRECNVEIRSICLETVAVVFINQWQFAAKPTLYYHDWMVRDFFEFLLRFQSPGSWAKPAGINEQIPLGEKWQSKTQSAYRNALSACQHEREDNLLGAIESWSSIFGDQFEAEWVPILRKLIPVGA